MISNLGSEIMGVIWRKLSQMYVEITTLVSPDHVGYPLSTKYRLSSLLPSHRAVLRETTILQEEKA